MNIRRTLEHGARAAFAQKNRADYVIPMGVLVVLTTIVALLERRADQTLAGERTLSLVAGLTLPVICLLGSREAGPQQLAWLARHGANRRWLWLGRKFVSLALSLFFVLSLLTTTYYVTHFAVRLDDLAICWGVMSLGCLAYQSVFGIIMRGRFALTTAGLWLLIDSWLGSIDFWLRHLSLRGHLMNLLFELRGTEFSPRLSSLILVSLCLTLLFAAWSRTPA